MGVVSRVDGFPKDNDSALLCITQICIASVIFALLPIIRCCINQTWCAYKLTGAISMAGSEAMVSMSFA